MILNEDGSPETFLQKLNRKCKAEPLVPLGAILTTGLDSDTISKI